MTRDKSDLYKLARKGLLLGAQEGNQSAGEEAFLHSDQFVLIDKEKRIKSTFFTCQIDNLYQPNHKRNSESNNPFA